MNERVWLHGHAESNYVGIPPADVYESIARDEWDALSELERLQYLDDLAGTALEQIASYGADVVDESEVPEAEK